MQLHKMTSVMRILPYNDFDVMNLVELVMSLHLQVSAQKKRLPVTLFTIHVDENQIYFKISLFILHSFRKWIILIHNSQTKIKQ